MTLIVQAYTISSPGSPPSCHNIDRDQKIRKLYVYYLPFLQKKKIIVLNVSYSLCTVSVLFW